MDYDIVEAISQIEEMLIASIMRSVATGDGSISFTVWKAQQLRELKRFRETHADLFPQFAENNDRLEEELRSAYEQARGEQQKEIIKAIRKGYSTEQIKSRFSGVNDKKLEALIEATKKDFDKAQKSILRKAEDEFRKLIFGAEVAYNTGSVTLQKAIDIAAKAFLIKGIQCIEYKNGAQMNIRSYSEMVLRTTTRRASIQGQAMARDEYGIKTVIVTKNSSPCPICEKYVGKVFIDDVYSNSKVPRNRKYPLLSKAVSDGLFHPNCTDSVHTYYEGITRIPRQATAEEKAEAKELYNLTQRQRYNERNIRAYKRLAKYANDDANKTKYNDLAKKWERANAELVASHDGLKRRKEREKVK